MENLTLTPEQSEQLTAAFQELGTKLETIMRTTTHMAALLFTLSPEMQMDKTRVITSFGQDALKLAVCVDIMYGYVMTAMERENETQSTQIVLPPH
jgi:deferrochelatase/peroxidase EfeB